jgi:hypothetical protein
VALKFFFKAIGYLLLLDSLYLSSVALSVSEQVLHFCHVVFADFVRILLTICRGSDDEVSYTCSWFSESIATLELSCSHFGTSAVVADRHNKCAIQPGMLKNMGYNIDDILFYLGNVFLF